jgi:hypothetical protein
MPLVKLIAKHALSGAQNIIHGFVSKKIQAHHQFAVVSLKLSSMDLVF